MRGKFALIPHLAILIGTVILNAGCAATKIESLSNDSEATMQIGNDSSHTDSTNRHSMDKKKKVDASEEKAVKKTVPPATWQESFVQEHSGRTPSAASGPVYDQYWSDVEKVSTNVLNGGGNKGSVTKAALAKNIDDGTFKGSEAQVAGALYESFDKIKSAGRLSQMISTPKIDASDISKTMSKVKNSEKNFHAIDDLAYWADNQNNLQRFSTNGSGSVTYKDITQALERKDLSANDRENLQQLELKFHAIAPDGTLGKKQIDNYYQSFINNDSSWALGKELTQDMRFIANAQNDPNSKKLFADANPIDSIKVDNVNEGFAGDCSFKAALAAVVGTNPQKVLGMLHPKNASDLQITFPGQKPIDIKPPSDEEVGLYSEVATRGNWASALEKGYGELMYQISPNKKALQTKTGAEKAASNGFSEVALRALTGHQIDLMDPSQMSTQQLRSALTAAQQEKMAVVINTPPGDPSTETKSGYAMDHAFTVLGINSKGDVTVRDPRAHGQNRPDGVSQITLDELKENFKQLWVETNKPLA